ITEHVFTAEAIGKIKRRLTDILKAIYENLKDTAKYVFTSEIDSSFAAKDSAGNVTDSIKVKSVVVSQEPLPSGLSHLLNFDLKHFGSNTETIINNTKLLEKKTS